MALSICVSGIVLATLSPFHLALPTQADLRHAIFTSGWRGIPILIETTIERAPFFVIGVLISGLLLREGKHPGRIVVRGLYLIALLELSQLFAAGRHGRWLDMLVASGLYIAGLRVSLYLKTRISERVLLHLPWLALACTTSALSFLLWQGSSVRQMGAWNCAFEISIGNEHGLQRQWLGEIHQIQISNSIDQIVLLPQTINDGPAVIKPETRIVPSTLPTGFCETIKRKKSFIVSINLKRSVANLEGPARIVTWSESIYDQNMMIGEERGRFHFRLKTGPHSLPTITEIRTPRINKTEEITELKVIYTNGQMKMEMDENVVASGSTVDVKLSKKLAVPRILIIGLLSLIMLPLLFEITKTRDR